MPFGLVNEAFTQQSTTKAALLKSRAAPDVFAEDRGHCTKKTGRSLSLKSFRILHNALLGKDVSINLDVNSLRTVDDLGNAEIRRDAHQ